MARESTAMKAQRYLVEGRLYVQQVDSTSILAECRGAGEMYRLGYGASTGWFCSCAAKGVCAHLAALALVCVKPTGLEGRRHVTEDEARRTAKEMGWNEEATARAAREGKIERFSGVETVWAGARGWEK